MEPYFIKARRKATNFRYVEGGMGSVSLAIGNAAREAGAHIITNAEVCSSKHWHLILFFHNQPLPMEKPCWISFKN